MSFVSRKMELELLTDLCQRPDAQFLILYGRRRVGKTALITHWAGGLSQPHLYWMASQTSAVNQLRNFSQALFQFLNPGAAVTPTFSYPTWDAAFAEVARFAANAAGGHYPGRIHLRHAGRPRSSQPHPKSVGSRFEGEPGFSHSHRIVGRHNSTNGFRLSVAALRPGDRPAQIATLFFWRSGRSAAQLQQRAAGRRLHHDRRRTGLRPAF
jgi:hypothetical protein